jgi:hypothetical protein
MVFSYLRWTPHKLRIDTTESQVAGAERLDCRENPLTVRRVSFLKGPPDAGDEAVAAGPFGNTAGRSITCTRFAAANGTRFNSM